MPKPRLLPETEESIYQAWQPHLGHFDVRWASELPPFGRNIVRVSYDTDLDEFLQKDLDTLLV